MRHRWLGMALALSSLAACAGTEEANEPDSDTTGPTTTVAEATTTGPAVDPVAGDLALLSAFFGLDDALPPISEALCAGAPGMDGLVVVVNHRLTSVTSDQFEVVTKSGARRTPMCATLAPANEPEERRTVLLIGDLGSAATDPPVEVVTPRSLDTEVGGAGAIYAGRSIAVTPLVDGPSLVAAEWVDRSTDCPSNTTAVLRVGWSGGIVRADGGAITPDATGLYTLTTDDPSATPIELVGLGDLGDNDNYHELCTASTPQPVVIAVAAGTFQDPNADANSTVEFTQR